MDKASGEQVQLSTHGRSGVPERLWSITQPCPAPHTEPTPQPQLLTHQKIPIPFLWCTQLIFFPEYKNTRSLRTEHWERGPC